MKLLDCILDYQEKFDGKTCQVSTNYKHLETFEVDFCLTDLHHLFGLHKITRDYASQTIPAIQAGVFILEEYKNNPMYNDVIERISLYSFIGDIFYSKITSCCILAKDLSKNTMKLALHPNNGTRENALMQPVFCNLQETGHLISVEF